MTAPMRYFCRAPVYHRIRYPDGSMHTFYTQCRRHVQEATDVCWQHWDYHRIKAARYADPEPTP